MNHYNSDFREIRWRTSGEVEEHKLIFMRET